MATTSRPNISSKFENNDIPTEEHFGQIIESFVHKDDKADFQMVEIGTDNEHYITPALLNVGLKNIGIITGNSYMPKKEYFDISLTGATTVSLEEFPIPNSVRVYKNGQLLQEGEGENLDYDYSVNYNTAIITFSGVVSDRNIEVDYWYKNLSPNPGSGGGETGEPIDFSAFLHTTGNETKSGILTFNNTTPSSTSGIVLTNSGDGIASKALDITVSGSGSGISLQNSSTGKGVYLNSTAEATGDILQVAKNNVVKAKIDSEGNVTAGKFVTSAGLRSQFVKGDGFLDPTVYAEDSKALHTTGEESKDGALTLTNSLPQDVLTIEKSNNANCLKLVQNSNDADTTSTWDTSTDVAERTAISIRKLGDEYAFITHDGDVAARSFTTQKANLTDDGLFSLENRPSPESSEGKAKLYAKNDGTDTHMYVMGSDGVEKKIGGDVDLSSKENTVLSGTTAQYYRGDKSWQTLDKTAVGLANVDNTSDLNKPISIATQTALNVKQAILVSGTNIKTVNGISVVGSGDIVIAGGGTAITGTANKIAKFNSTGNNVIESNVTDNGTSVTITKPTTIDSGTMDISGLTLSRIANSSSEVMVANGFSSASSTVLDITKSYAYSTDGNQIWKVNITSGEKTLLPLTGTTIPSASYGNHICRDNASNLYMTSSDKIYKINPSNVVTLFATVPVYSTDILFGIDNNFYVINIHGVLTKITLSGIVSNVINNLPVSSSIAQDNTGNFYIADTNLKVIYKVTPQGVSTLFFTAPREISDLLLKDSNTMYVFYNAGGGFVKNIYELNLSTATLTSYENVSFGISYKSFLDSSGNIYIQSYNQLVKIKVAAKVLKTDSSGLIVKTTYLEDVPYLKSSDIDLSSYAKLDSPALTGIPTAPTATVGTNTTQLATTAFVLANGSNRPYKTFSCIVNQAGSNAPTSITLQNDTGLTIVPSWEITGNGDYRFFVGTVNSTKFFPYMVTGSWQIDYYAIGANIQGQYVQITSKQNGIKTNGIINNALLEIRVYP